MAAAGKKNYGSMEMVTKLGTPPPPGPKTWVSAASAAARPRSASVRSVTRDEIERYWRRKKMDEEDHLLAALKAAARIRARNLKEEEYRQFEASLECILGSSADTAAGKKSAGRNDVDGGGEKELTAVIWDWWTNSKYAYLNQPALQSMERPDAATKRTSTFVPNACFYPAVSTKPYSALGVF